MSTKFPIATPPPHFESDAECPLNGKQPAVRMLPKKIELTEKINKNTFNGQTENRSLPRDF